MFNTKIDTDDRIHVVDKRKKETKFVHRIGYNLLCDLKGKKNIFFLVQQHNDDDTSYWSSSTLKEKRKKRGAREKKKQKKIEE